MERLSLPLTIGPSECVDVLDSRHRGVKDSIFYSLTVTSLVVDATSR
jgi:hypothetical protein